MIEYKLSPDLDLDAMIEFYNSCSLGAWRPTGERERMAMVREGYQKLGIGPGLIRRTQQAGGPDIRIPIETRMIVLSAPAAVEYSPRIFFTQHPSAWTILGDEPLL